MSHRKGPAASGHNRSTPLLSSLRTPLKNAETDEENDRLKEEKRLNNFWSGVRGIVGIQSSHHIDPKALLLDESHKHDGTFKSVALNDKKVP